MKAGEHELIFEEPDTVIMRLVGEVSEEDVEKITAAAGRFVAGRPRVFWVVGMARAGGMSGGARRRMVEWARRNPSAGSAYVKASAPARCVITMLHHAVRLFSGVSPELGFAATEEEARAWIAAQRGAAQPGAAQPGAAQPGAAGPP